MFKKFDSRQPSDFRHYDRLRTMIISKQHDDRQLPDYDNNLFIHFTFCRSMRQFPKQFVVLWQKYFSMSPISEVKPILGTKNVNNLHRDLVFNP